MEEPMNKKEWTRNQLTAIEEVKQLFSAWRKTKTGRERIPDNLWDAAVKLFQTWELSINKVARSLSLSHSALKAKITEAPSDAIESINDNETPTFIEVESPFISSDCVIEMEHRSGVKMRMCFRGRADPAVISLGRYFLENNS
jgi:hypothetical protein